MDIVLLFYKNKIGTILLSYKYLGRLDLISASQANQRTRGIIRLSDQFVDTKRTIKDGKKRRC